MSSVVSFFESFLCVCCDILKVILCIVSCAACCWIDVKSYKFFINRSSSSRIFDRFFSNFHTVFQVCYCFVFDKFCSYNKPKIFLKQLNLTKKMTFSFRRQKSVWSLQKKTLHFPAFPRNWLISFFWFLAQRCKTAMPKCDGGPIFEKKIFFRPKMPEIRQKNRFLGFFSRFYH